MLLPHQGNPVEPKCLNLRWVPLSQRSFLDQAYQMDYQFEFHSHLINNLINDSWCCCNQLNLYSRSNRSCTISICKRPKKPHLNPNPNACDTSGSNWRELSFKASFSKATLSDS